MASTATRRQTRQYMDLPEGALVNLAGLEKIQGFGDKMQVPGMRGNIALETRPYSEGRPLQAQTVVSAGETAIEHVPADKARSGAKKAPSKALPKLGVGSGGNQVFIQPLHLTTVKLNGLPSETEEMGVVIQGQRYFFNAVLSRREDGTWAPTPGAPPQAQWYVINGDGVSQPPDVVKLVFDQLLRAAELYYRAKYRDFVLAELAWFNNTILEFEEGSALATKLKGKKPTAAQKQLLTEFYAARFSGKMAAMRAGEQQLLAWLDKN